MNGMDGLYSASAIRGINLGSLDPRPDGPDPVKEFLLALGQLSASADEPGARATPTAGEPDGSARPSFSAAPGQESGAHPIVAAEFPAASAAFEVPRSVELQVWPSFPDEPELRASKPQPRDAQSSEPQVLVDLGAVLAAKPAAGLVERFSFGTSG